MSSAELKRLLLIIEQQLDWGDAATWQSRDFETLNQLIFEKTKISLSASTLRRVWGRVEYTHMPSGTTLDTLAIFAGFENWRSFTRQRAVDDLVAKEILYQAARPKEKPGWLFRIALMVIALITISLVSMYVKKTSSGISKTKFSFDTRPVTRTIPNSVVFTYDVKTNPTDSVFIEQSWDPNTRVRVDKNLHQYTSIYYRPGFYHAKLGINNHVVKERLLLIPSDGWLGLIANRPVPVYLNRNEFINKDGLQVTPSTISKKNILLEPQPPTVEYYNVGNFKPVPLKEFSFSTEVKNDYHDGSSACQFISIILFTDNTPVIVQLSAKGCVSDLRLLNGGYFISGKNNDLSGFGTDLSQWVKVAFHNIPGKIQYFVNDKLVYESARPLYNENIVGIGYTFQGTGSVKGITLKDKDETVFQDF
jgi:hypothetical protein